MHVDAVGVKTLGSHDPMQRDTIFRIASMTKPITAVAALIESFAAGTLNAVSLPGFFDTRGWGFGVCVITHSAHPAFRFSHDLTGVPGLLDLYVPVDRRLKAS